MEPGSTVLVTGGAGFIGSQVTILLVERGLQVRVLDNFRRPRLAVLAPYIERGTVELVEGDVRYRASVEDALDNVSAVVHLAAAAITKSIVDPSESIDINLVGSDNVFGAAAAAGVQRCVFASTASVYGEPETLPMREDGPLRPQTPYCISKLAAEQLLEFYGRETGLPWNILRFFNVYGPGQTVDAYYTSVVLSFVDRLRRGEAPVIDGDGQQSLDFVHVRDVARAVVLALECETTGNICNIGSGRPTTLTELARLLTDLVGVDVRPEFRPGEPLVSRRAADIRRAADVLGWSPEVSAPDGFAEVVKDAIRDGD